MYSRREWLSAMAAIALSPKLCKADLPGFYYRDYSKCLPEYLTSLADAAYAKRKAQLEQLTDASAIRDRQQWVREQFWRMIGGKPERTPLKAHVTGALERRGYRIEKVVYESRPQTFVSANLYIPRAGNGPYPGVLFQMGHSIKGKAYPSYQKCCQGLAQLGYVVLAFDPMGQGERIAYPDSSGTNSRLGSPTAEHDVPGKQLLLLGDSATRYQVWDAIRSLDYLASHESVDPKRLASAGQSGGATLTMLLACVDDRLSAAAVSSGNTEDFSCADFIAPGSTDDAEQDLIGSGIIGLDRWDLLYPMAPKPLLVEVSAHDFFGTYSPNYLKDGKEEFDRLANVYKRLGQPEKLCWCATPLPHALTYSLRLSIYNWFERWLNQSDKVIEAEPEVTPEQDSQLWVGPTGDVGRDFGSMRAFDLIRAQASSVRRESAPGAWRRVLPVSLPPAEVRFRKLADVPFRDAQVAAVELNTDPGFWVPGWLFLRQTKKPATSCLLALDPDGRNAQAHEDGLYHQLASNGVSVCAVDIRGIGDTRPETGGGNPEYQIPHEAEEEYAWASLILGKPLLAQRITDILAVVRALKNNPETAGSAIAVAARGHLTVPALFAFQASGDIQSLYLSGGLVSFQSVLETEVYKQPLSNFAWDLFRCTDLPDLAAHSAPRQIHIAGAVDGAGSTLAVPAVRNIYTSRNIRVSSAPKWDVVTLRSVSL